MGLILRSLGWLIKACLTLLVFLTPVLGVWLASSLVAFSNGPKWLVVSSGILLFPLLPIAWDLYTRRKQPQTGILTWGDRILLRTLGLNLAFLILLLALRPQTSFLALSTRGDWMLDGQHGAAVDLIRQGLFRTANGLEWLYLSFHSNPFAEYADSRQIRPSPNPSAVVTQPTSTQPTTTQPPGTQPTIRPQPNTSRQGWPWTDSGLHPAVAKMPAAVETSIESVAQYLAQQEQDPFLRVKALHDYVADRIAYDAPAYFGQTERPSQDAETVFRTRKAVCAGYAKLLEALGKAAGEEIVYMVGDSRSQTSDLSGQGHAWNAAKIQGNWYLIDATWDSGFVNSATTGFQKNFRMDYLFPPPEVMVISHFPAEAAWQLLAQPLSRGEFLRQPMLKPRFFAEGLKLINPTRSQTDVATTASLDIANPQQRWLMATYNPKGAGEGVHCAEQTTQGSRINCPLPAPGSYEIKLFSSDQQYGQSYGYVGQLEFNRS